MKSLIEAAAVIAGAAVGATIGGLVGSGVAVPAALSGGGPDNAFAIPVVGLFAGLWLGGRSAGRLALKVTAGGPAPPDRPEGPA